MNDACKHKAAAASIDWMVGLIKHKTSSDHVATRLVLETMFHEMVDKNCQACAVSNYCHELDSARRVLSGPPSNAEAYSKITSLSPGALLIRRLVRRGQIGRVSV